MPDGTFYEHQGIFLNPALSTHSVDDHLLDVFRMRKNTVIDQGPQSIFVKPMNGQYCWLLHTC